MSFPTATPSYAGFTGSHTLSQDNHAAQHNSEQTDIIGIATKVGTGTSTPTSGVFLRGNGAGTSAWSPVTLSGADVTGVLPTSNGGTGLTSAAALNLQVLAAVYRVGCIYTETTGTNPAIGFGFGTWVAFGSGRVLVGNGTSDQAFTAGTSGGESTHVLTTTEMPSHTHGYASDRGNISWAGGTGTGSDSSLGNGKTTTAAGSDGAHNNLQPYIVVYFWQRTA